MVFIGFFQPFGINGVSGLQVNTKTHKNGLPIPLHPWHLEHWISEHFSKK